MQSNNPVFNRNDAFAKGGYATFDTPTATQLEDMYAAPSAIPVRTGRMTVDDVVTKLGISFAVLLVGAAVGWFVPGLWIVGMLVGLVLGLVNSFKQEPSPALILAYAGGRPIIRQPPLVRQSVRISIEIGIEPSWKSSGSTISCAYGQ